MKHLLHTLALSLTLTPAFAQLEQGSKVIDGGFRLGIYQTTSKQDSEPESEDGEAAAKLFPFNFEYAMGPRLGITGTFQFSKYFVDKDSATSIQPEAHSIDIAPGVNFHIVNRKRFDLLASGCFGFSSFKYNTNDGGGGSFSGQGIFFNLRGEMRIYIGNYFCLLLNAGYINFNYPSGKITDNAGNKTEDISFKLAGPNFGTGLGFRF